MGRNMWNERILARINLRRVQGSSGDAKEKED